MKLPRPNGLPRKKKGLSDERLQELAAELPLIYKGLLVEATRITERKRYGRKIPPVPVEEQDAFLLSAGLTPADVETGLKKIMGTVDEEKARRKQASQAGDDPRE